MTEIDSTRWTSVNNLPDSSRKVRVRLSDGTKTTAHYLKDHRVWSVSFENESVANRSALLDVTHWAPLKRRPKKPEQNTGALYEALRQAKCARQSIGFRQNRGYEKEQAREGYESCLNEILVPALLSHMEMVLKDDSLEPRDIERLAQRIYDFTSDKT